MVRRQTCRLFLLASLAVAGGMVTAAAGQDETSIAAGTRVVTDLVYATRPMGPVRLDLLTPPGPGPFPLVLWIHGGAWKSGDKAAWPHMNFLTGHGYAVANVEYRFSQVAPFPAQIDDCTAALDFLIAHAAEDRLDASRIAVAGESAGGHLAALLGMRRAASTTRPAAGVRAVIDLFGPADIATAATDPNLRDIVEQLLGGPLASHAALADDASPLRHVAAGDPPFLILHGTSDPLVPIGQSRQLVAALQAAGVPVDFVPVPGAGHAGPMFWTPPMQDKMLGFLNASLQPQH